jgi:hypothetical protein
MNDAALNPGLMQKDPAKGETENDEVLAKAIEAARKYGSVCWAFQDERHCVEDPGLPNDEGLRRFRKNRPAPEDDIPGFGKRGTLRKGFEDDLGPHAPGIAERDPDRGKGHFLFFSSPPADSLGSPVL